ncbi:MAG: hypothetical protein O7161_04425, partial [Wolbachia endosymbiont of Halictus tumulorum]|nr:hypothetical protein [Wolbachia endosymbiont of Halictus tumulorum]
LKFPIPCHLYHLDTIYPPIFCLPHHTLFFIPFQDRFLDHFDQFFTITEVSNKKNRSELMNLARAYKMISEEDPDKIQDFLATQTKSYSYEIMLPEIDNFLSQAR